jgi:hypothetical protein
MNRFLPLLLALFSACSLGAGGDGCVRVHQGDYTFPLKQVVKGAVKVRISQQGIDRLASKTKELLLGFFDADENGHAIIPLSELGLGELTTDLGPFEGKFRDVTLTLNLDALVVEIVEGAYPPRLRITVKNAEVGLLGGELVGTAEAGLFEGNAACLLGNGPSGKVALLSFELLFDLVVAADGTLDLSIKSTDVDLQDIDLSVTTDCSISECLDGETPPSDAECSECEALCDTVELVASLSSQFQGVFDQLIDELVSVLGDELSNVLADTLLNGKPFAVEGELDVGTLLGQVIDYLKGAQPLGLVVRPAGDGFESVSEPAGVEMLLDAGVTSMGLHECASADPADAVFTAKAAPKFPNNATKKDGTKVPYELGLTLSDAIVNETLWAAWRSGVLCLGITSSDLLTLTGGSLDLRASHLELLFPGLGSIVPAESPVRVSLSPGFSASDPPAITFGDGQEQSTITLPLPQLRVAIDVMVDGHPIQLIALQAGVTMGLSVETLGEAKLGLRVDTVDIDSISVIGNGFFGHAELDTIVELVVDLGVTVLEKTLGPIELDAGSLVSGLLDESLSLSVLQMADLGETGWLTMLFGLSEVAASPDIQPVVSATLLGLGTLHLEPNHHGTTPIQYRVDGSTWSTPRVGDTTLNHPRLWLVGEHRVEARMRGEDGPPGVATEIGFVVTTAPEKKGGEALQVEVEHEPATTQGCTTSGGQPGHWVWTLCLLLLWPGRRLRRYLGLLVICLFGLQACADERSSLPASCQENENCPAGFLCSSDDQCVPSSACTSNKECCPGAVCFNGWCRPTQECSDSCEGLDEHCVDDQCVPTNCESDDGCSAWSRCVGGRCIHEHPCGGQCTADQACDLNSGRCLASTSCPAPCPSGTFRSVSSQTQFDALTCLDNDFACTCLPYPEVPKGMPGIDGVMVTLDASFAVLSYDDRYGDLIYSEFSKVDLARKDWVVDGVPDGPVLYAADGYRQGVAEPGPDRGVSPTVLLNSTSEGNPLLDIVYHDREVKSLWHARFDPTLHQTIHRTLLPVEGQVGSFSCLVKSPQTNRLTGLVYVEKDAGGTLTQLVRIEALVDDPQSANDWSSEVLLSRPLPQTKAEPCSGECGLTELCVLGPAGEVCASALDSEACAEPCPAHRVCLKGGGQEASTCWPRVYFDGQPEWVGTGLFLSCAVKDDQLAAAWYDADLGTAVASLGTPLGSEPTLIAGTTVAHDAPDVGLHMAIELLDGGQAVLAFQDRFGQDLRVALSSESEEWAAEVVVDGSAGVSQPGGWSSMHGVAGLLALVEQDGVSGGIGLHVREPNGCWAHHVVWPDQVYTHPAVHVVDGTSAIVSARQIAFDSDLMANHDLVLELIELPVCSAD